MESNILSIIIGAVALVIGVVLGKIVFAKNTKKQVEEAEQQSKLILKEAELRAENLKKEKELDAKEKFVQMKAAHDKDVMQRNQKILDSENRIKQKEQGINQKEGNLDKQVKENEAIKETLNRQIEVVNSKRTELEKHQEEHIRRLEKVAGLSAEDAKAQLIDSLKRIPKHWLFSRK
jgi:ribonuclease Y